MNMICANDRIEWKTHYGPTKGTVTEVYMSRVEGIGPLRTFLTVISDAGQLFSITATEEELKYLQVKWLGYADPESLVTVGERVR